MRRAATACATAAAAFLLAGCEEIVDYITDCSSGPVCDSGAGRCDGSKLLVCRGGINICGQDNYWEEKEDCAATARVCYMPDPHTAWCVPPGQVPTTILAEAGPTFAPDVALPSNPVKDARLDPTGRRERAPP
jgi:hypothetical protein